MKIVIDLAEINDTGVAPNFIYHALYMEYWEKLQRTYHSNLWGLATACDSAARALYSQKTGRKLNVKSLILTYNDAESCFELFKQFANVWAENYAK